MSTRSPFRPALPAVALALAVALTACKGNQEAEPGTAKIAVSTPSSAKDQAKAALMALPELQAWAAQIEKASGGTVRGALIEDDPAPRNIDGKNYWQFSFVENRSDAVRRLDSFLVAQSGAEILVEDFDSDTTLTLEQWRRDKRPLERIVGQ
jgi:spermidine/putrescine-binding protein